MKEFKKTEQNLTPVNYIISNSRYTRIVKKKRRNNKSFHIRKLGCHQAFR
jgi:hypothetical protein